jgi:choline dehydrogenase-like flavoprotein
MASSNAASSRKTPNHSSLDGASFDYIICGGGTSGCLIAARLAALSGTSVLLVEAGRDSGLAPDVLVPGKYVHQLSADVEGLWQLHTFPQAQLNDRELVFLRGKQLGGSS